MEIKDLKWIIFGCKLQFFIKEVSVIKCWRNLNFNLGLETSQSLKGVLSYFLWLSIFRFLANFGRFCFVIRLKWGFWGWRCRLWHLWIVLGTFSCPKWLNFSPIPAKAKIPNLRPILLCNMAFIGENADYDIVLSLWKRFVSADVFWVYFYSNTFTYC